MSKNREEKRRRKKQKMRSRGQPSATKQPRRPEKIAVPSAQTMWRTMHLNFRAQETLIKTTMDTQPSLWKRDANKIQRIEQAVGIEAVLDLAPNAGGLAEYAWLKRVLEFGSSAGPAIVARLNSDWMRSHAKERTGIQERFISALRFCDDEAANGLMGCWEALDDYGRSLACVAFGLLDVQSAAGRLWTFFEKTQSRPRFLWVGPLWGLIDLGDHRAADALAKLLEEKQAFYEKYGFLSRAGDVRALVPLFTEILEGAEDIKADATWALTGIAHRLGRDRFSEVLRGSGNDQETENSKLDSFVDHIFLYSQQDVERNFETFYDRDARSLINYAKNPDRQH